jgi:hypothetical protein
MKINKKKKTNNLHTSPNSKTFQDTHTHVITTHITIEKYSNTNLPFGELIIKAQLSPSDAKQYTTQRHGTHKSKANVATTKILEQCTQKRES